MLKRTASLFCLVFLLLSALNLILVVSGYAQDAPAADAPIWKQLLDLAMKSLVPALWVAAGPMAVAGITKLVNKYADTYVPASIQVIISALLAGVAAGLTGDLSTGIQAATGGATGQVLAATKPDTLVTGSKE